MHFSKSSPTTNLARRGPELVTRHFALPKRACTRTTPTSTLSSTLPMGCAGFSDFTASTG
jgi:hypothetical protein